MKNYYELLEIAREAPAEEVKKSFRAQIAKYHPDKVHHLGKEFQAMAADARGGADRGVPDSFGRGPPCRLRRDACERRSGGRNGRRADQRRPRRTPEPAAARSSRSRRRLRRGQVSSIRNARRRDTFVRKATMDRFRQAFAQVAGRATTKRTVRGFDFASAPKTRLFGRGKGPRFWDDSCPASTRRRSRAPGPTPAAGSPSGDEICVMLMGTVLASRASWLTPSRAAPETGTRRGKVTLIPVDSSVWDAHMPTDAPPVAKELLTRLAAANERACETVR